MRGSTARKVRNTITPSESLPAPGAANNDVSLPVDYPHPGRNPPDLIAAIWRYRLGRLLRSPWLCFRPRHIGEWPWVVGKPRPHRRRPYSPQKVVLHDRMDGVLHHHPDHVVGTELCRAITWSSSADIDAGSTLVLPPSRPLRLVKSISPCASTRGTARTPGCRHYLVPVKR